MERWAEVVGFEGWYEVSDLGRVRRVSEKRKQTKLGDYVKSPSPNPSGYVQYVFCVNRKVTSHLAHRLMWAAFRGPIPDGMQINHRNGIKTDNRLDNLELCTPSENVLHGFRELTRRQRDQRGEKNFSCKLTDAEVENIKAQLSDGVPGWKVAQQFSVSQALISLIKNKKRRTT